jgi:ABC-type lipopolysaccharide export system ATPase subunit
MTTQTVQALDVQGLEKSYDELRVLRGVDFDVARGSIFALLGSNGAGKTTIVKLLSTLLKPDAGTASVAGFDVATQAADVRESISLTGQFAAVDEILTGLENLILMARLRRVKDAGQLADDLLAHFQLTDAAKRRVATYSGGERRRLDIAMSLMGNPPVIFIQLLNSEVAEHTRAITTLVRVWRPDLLTRTGVGPIVAAIVLCAWSHPGRCPSDAAFAMLGGAAPIPASSGQTVRVRLNRSGDRHLNQALHLIVLTRLRYDPATRAHAQRRRAQARPTANPTLPGPLRCPPAVPTARAPSRQAVRGLTTRSRTGSTPRQQAYAVSPQYFEEARMS